MSIYVDQKNTGLANVEDAETKALLIEDAETAKTLLALSPSHPSFAILSARRTAIRTTIINKGK